MDRIKNKLRIVAMVLFAMAGTTLLLLAQNAPLPGYGIPGDTYKNVIGVVHHEVADSSPVISVILTATASPYLKGKTIAVHVKKLNTSDHEIEYVNLTIVLVVFDSNGNIAPETELGCQRHWFSPCYYTQGRNRIPWTNGKIAPGGTSEYDKRLSDDYDLSKPGTYTVMGYMSGYKEGPEYFKTNTIKITIE
jgi:hypothetical protein